MSQHHPLCAGSHKDCYAYKHGKCRLLKSCDFGERKCPFYTKPESAPTAARMLNGKGGAYA